MRQKYERHRVEAPISASEIAAFVYCPESWRLQYGEGLAPLNGAALAEGDLHHRRKRVAERLAGGLLVVGRLLIVVAALAVLLLLWWSQQ